MFKRRYKNHSQIKKLRRILLRKLSEKVTINECELLKSLGTFKNMKYEFYDYPQTSFLLDFKFISSLERRSVFFSKKKDTISMQTFLM